MNKEGWMEGWLLLSIKRWLSSLAVLGTPRGADAQQGTEFFDADFRIRGNMAKICDKVAIKKLFEEGVTSGSWESRKWRRSKV